MRKRFRSQTDEDALEEPIVNLTPLIDVVFVVLICFILIAPILDVDSVSLSHTSEVPKKNYQEGPLAIYVRSDNTIWVDQKKINLKELKTLSLNQKKRAPQTIPQLLSDKNATFGTYQEVKNILENVGFEQMDIVLKP